MPSALVDVTGVTPQQLAPTLDPGYAYRVLGFGLTSSGSGLAVVKAGSTVVAKIAMPGGEVARPDVSWGMVGADRGPLTVAADTAGVQVVGHLVYDVVRIPAVPVPDVEFVGGSSPMFAAPPVPISPSLIAPMPSSNGV